MDNRNRGKRMLGLMVGMAAGVVPKLMPNLKPRRKPVELTRSMYEKARRSVGYRGNATGKIHGARECNRRRRQLAYGQIYNCQNGNQYAPGHRIEMAARRLASGIHPHTVAPEFTTRTEPQKINFGTPSDAS